jgi:hypothetical protein
MSDLGQWTIIYIVLVALSLAVSVVGFKVGAKLKLNKLNKVDKESSSSME